MYICDEDIFEDKYFLCSEKAFNATQMAMSLQGVRKGISMRQGRRPLVRRGESNLLKSG